MDHNLVSLLCNLPYVVLPRGQIYNLPLPFAVAQIKDPQLSRAKMYKEDKSRTVP